MRFNPRSALLLNAAIWFAAGSQAFSAEPAKKGAAAKQSAREDAATALSKPINLEFIDTPLSDVITYIDAYAHIQSLFEPGAPTDLREDAKVTINLHAIPLETALDLILEPTGLDYFTRGGILVITTKDSAAETMETKVFDVTALVSDNAADQESSLDGLIDVIARTVEPSSWPDVGGRGVMVPYRHGSTCALVVVNSQRAHRKIAALLADLRSAVAGRAPPQAARENAPPGQPPTAAGVSGFALTHLAPTDEAVIECESMGCFHFMHYELAFSGKAPGRVRVSEATGADDQPERRYLATVSFTAADQRRLDKQIAFYRTKHPGGCTTGEQMKISVARDGAIVRHETFVDASCTQANVLFAIARRAELRTPAQ